MSIGKKVVGLLVAGLTLIAAASCSSSPQTHGDGSRHELFDSLQALWSASSLVVVVDVHDQTVIDEVNPTTLSTVTVIESFTPEGLGSALKVLPAEPPAKIQVRQLGSSGMSLPYPILQTGDQYLLFLTPSMLEGDEAKQFFVTGGSAGIFNADGDTFVHGPFEEGDRLPEKITAEDLK